jgi:hypothetical protein
MSYDIRYVPAQCDGRSVVKGSNPRLYEPVRGQWLLLDRPNLTGEVCVGDVPKDQIYTPFIKQYGGQYSDYSQIVGGQVQYWVPKCVNVFEPPVFTNSAVVSSGMFVDPMGVVKPQYDRYPVPNPCDENAYYSSTLDQIKYRENLMASQLAKPNQVDFRFLYNNLKR